MKKILHIGIRFLIVLEVSLVMNFFILSFSNFFYFIVIDVQLLSIEWFLMKFSFSSGSFFWRLEANKSIEGFTFFEWKLHWFNLTISSKQFLQLFFGSIGWEVLHIQVASLLWVLVSEHLLLLLSFSLRLWKSWLAVDNMISINLFSMEFTDSSVSALLGSDTSFLVVVKADKAKSTWFILHYSFGWHLAKGSEQFSEIILVPFNREIFDIDIIKYFLEVSLIFGMIWFSMSEVSIFGALYSNLSRLDILVAYEAIAIWLMVLIKRNLATLDFTILPEFLIQLRRCPLFGNIFHKNVLINGLSSVSSQKVFVKW